MIRKLFRWLNPTSGQEHLGPIRPEDISVYPDDQAISPFTAARQMVDAYDKRKNEQQNIGRAWLLKTAEAHTLAANQFIIPAVTPYTTMPSTLRAWLTKYCQPVGADGVAFVCQESGYHNIKAGIDVELSMAAVVDTKVTRAEAQLIYSPKGNPNFHLLWQDTQYASVRVVPGFPETAEALYMRGWSHSFADKVYMNCGDMLWMAHLFQGLVGVDYVERYEARIAIQRTGEPFISQECCEHA